MENQEKPGINNLSRRDFTKSIVVTGMALPFSGSALSAPISLQKQEPLICVFSKHLQWLSIPEAAKTAAGLGFKGIDLTVRKGGHVEPEKAIEELPKAIKLFQKEGLQVPMMVTDIVDANDPKTENLLKTAVQSGITYYRMGYLKYDPKISVVKNLEIYKVQIQKLATLNEKYQIHGAYQNHAGANVGAAVWDLWQILKDCDPRWMGCQYDIKHAVAEGGMSWVNGLDVIQPHIRCVDIKDFIWAKKDGKWENQVVPLGEGMVDYKSYFSLLAKYKISGPFSMHFEYPLGGAETGKKQLSVSQDVVLAAMKKDLQTLQSLLAQTNSAG